MNVLITGVAGFIGSHLADRLLADGHEVVGVDDLSTGRRENVAVGVDFYERDINEMRLRILEPFPGSVRKFGPLDLVIHCAASYKDPDKWHRDTNVNVTGTINALITAKREGCPIVYMQTALPPVSSYAISKTAGMQYIQQSGVPHLIFRLANIYGPRNLSGPVPVFFDRLTRGLPCTVVDTTRDMVYIDDLVDCVMYALDVGFPLFGNGVWDVCSGDRTSIAELYRLVGERLYETVPEAKVVPPGADEAQTFVNPANRILGWEAEVGVARGILQAVDWYRENGVSATYTHLRMEEAAV